MALTFDLGETPPLEAPIVFHCNNIISVDSQTIALMGRLPSGRSIAAILHNMPRQVFLRPVDGASSSDVFNELGSMLSARDIKLLAHAEREMRHIGDLAPWRCVGITYRSRSCNIPSTLRGKTFSEINETSMNVLETFVHATRFDGTGFVRIDKATISKQRVTWARDEYIVEQPSDLCINPDEVAEVNSVNLAIDITYDQRNRVKSITYIESYERQIAFCDEGDERTLLVRFISHLARIDPDYIICYAFDVEKLVERMKVLQVPDYQRLGVLRQRMTTAGRVIFNVDKAARELQKLSSYELGFLVRTLLKREPEEPIKDIVALHVHLSVYEHYTAVANITCTPMSIAVRCGRAERNDWLLTRALFENHVILPPKKTGGDTGSYDGGLVLDPECGFYNECVLLLDFNSLYPSIISEYNICITGDGILPRVIANLVQSRREVKERLAGDGDYPERQRDEALQKTLKLVANSMYGCLAYPEFRYSNRDIAATITAHGRRILVETAEFARSHGFRVIYGDTDSLMIATGLNDVDEVTRQGREFCDTVNAKYTHLKLGVDKIFSKLLLLCKKKYAGQRVDKSELQLTGLESSMDCTLTRSVMHRVLEIIFTDPNPQEACQEYLSEIRANMETMQPDVFVIHKLLKMDPDRYADDNSPHVRVARVRKLRRGDSVPYIIANDGTSNGITMRAYHPLDIQQRGLKVDVQYYATTHVQAPISRILSAVPDLDLAAVFHAFGGHKRALEEEEEAVVFSTAPLVPTSKTPRVEITCSTCGYCGGPSDDVKCGECGVDLSEDILKYVNEQLSQPLPASRRCSYVFCGRPNSDITVDHCACGALIKNLSTSDDLYTRLSYLYSISASNTSLATRITSVIDAHATRILCFETLFI